MKKTTKIIIALGVLVVVAAVVLTASLLASKNKKGADDTSAPSFYTLASLTQTTTANTEAWIDLDAIASDLATATDTTSESDTSTTETTVPQTIVYPTTPPQPLTTIIYVYESRVPETTQAPQLTETTTKKVEFEPEMSEYKYTINSETKTVTLNKYLGDSSVVWIPETLGGYTVTEIGAKCFENNSLTAVCIREDVRTIGDNAFLNCKNLTTVTFLGAPYTITVGNNAFKNCAKLKTINLPEAKSIGNSAFDGCKALTELTIREGTESIGDYCFTNCTNLTKLTIPESVSYIGTGAVSNHHKDLVIVCVSGSKAAEFANKYDVKIQYAE